MQGYYTVQARTMALLQPQSAYNPEPGLPRPLPLEPVALVVMNLMPLPSEHTPLGKAQSILAYHSWHKIVDQEQQPSDKWNKLVVMVETKLYSSKLGIGHRY
jgi:hypothetical protein